MTASHLNEIYYRGKIFWRLSGLTLFLILGYFYLISSIVWNGVKWQSTVSQLNQKQRDLVKLESEYLNLSSGITLDLAQRLGLEESSNRALFVPQVPVTPVVALLPKVLP